MCDDLKKISTFFLVMTAFFSLAWLTRTAGDGFLIKRSSGTMQISGPCRIFYKARLLCGFPLLDCQVYAACRL